MNESEWLSSAEPIDMARGAPTRVSHRKLRLFAAAVCRRILHLLSDDRSKAAVDVAERFADEQATLDNLQWAREQAHIAHREAFNRLGKSGACLEWAAVYVVDPVAYHGAKNVSWMAATPRIPGGVTDAEYTVQANLFREIFANPFRPVSIVPAWLALKVIVLAEAIYDDRRFADMPIRADALEEAGCTNADMLSHCRQPGEHVRGCWVVELLLGKT